MVNDRGDTTQDILFECVGEHTGKKAKVHTRITEKKPALTVFITSSSVVAPLMIAIDAK